MSEKKKKNWKDYFDLSSQLAGWISVVIAIISLNFDIGQSKEQQEKETRNLRLSIGDVNLQDNQYVSIGSSISSNKNALVIGLLPIKFTNISSKTLKDVNIIVRFPSLSRPEIIRDLTQIKINHPLVENKLKLIRNNYDDSVYVYNSYKIESINPGFSYEITEPFLFSDTVNNIFDMDMKGYKFSLELSYSFDCLVTVNGEDLPPQNNAFHLQLYKTSNLKELNEKVAINYVKSIIHQKDNISFLSKMLWDENFLSTIIYSEPRHIHTFRDLKFYELRTDSKKAIPFRQERPSALAYMFKVILYICAILLLLRLATFIVYRVKIFINIRNMKKRLSGTE